jgi:hypothetical protein
VLFRSAAQLADAHTRIGRALAERGAPAAVIAHHLHLGDDEGAAFLACRAAAERAVATYDFDSAALYYRWALEHAGAASAEERDRIAEGLADALVTSGHGADAVLALRTIPDRGPPGAMRRQRKLGHALLLAGEVQRGLAELQRSVRASGGALPAGPVRRVLRIGFDLCAARLRQLLGVAPFPSPRIEAAALAHRELALLHRWIDLYGAARHAAGYLRLAQRHGDASLRVDALAMYQVLLRWQGRTARADEVGAEAEALAATLADPAVHSQLALVQGLSRILGNELGAAIERWGETVDHARRAGDRVRQCLGLSSRGWALVYRGEFVAAIREFDQAQRVGGGELPWYAAEAAAGRAYAEVWNGELEAAAASAEALGRDA